MNLFTHIVETETESIQIKNRKRFHPACMISIGSPYPSDVLLRPVRSVVFGQTIYLLGPTTLQPGG